MRGCFLPTKAITGKMERTIKITSFAIFEKGARESMDRSEKEVKVEI